MIHEMPNLLFTLPYFFSTLKNVIASNLHFVCVYGQQDMWGQIAFFPADDVSSGSTSSGSSVSPAIIA